MKAVLITNKVTGQQWGPNNFENPEEWLKECEGKNKFGKDGDYTIVIEDVTEKINRKEAYIKAVQYLSETDWYVLRKYETGTEVPAEVVEKRVLARKIVEKGR